MTLKNKIWMNGSLEWFTYIDDEAVYLGKREVPMPLEDGDAWTNELGDMFRVEGGFIRLTGKTEPPRKCW